MRNFLIITFASVITASLIFVFVKNDVFNSQDVTPGKNTPDHSSEEESGPVSLTAQIISGKLTEFREEVGEKSDETFVSQDMYEIRDYVKAADKNLDKALYLISYEDRYLLIDQILDYDKNLSDALKLIRGAEDPNPDILAFMVSTTAYQLFSLKPLYYYIHSEAQSALRSIIDKLEEKRGELLTKLADADGGRAGELLAEDIELYIENIRKSAARRNSDFIKFSYEDYLEYRNFFDALVKIRPESYLSFAKHAHILFDDFYAAHEEVDLDYSDKTRRYVMDMRLGIRDTHKQALIKLRELDEVAASNALNETISVIESELRLHSDWRSELSDIMKDDLGFYNAIKNNKNN